MFRRPLLIHGLQHYDTGGVASNTTNSISAGQAAAGIGEGAATGAAIGSVVPGIGTAIGAVGGALVGGTQALGSALTPQDQYQAQLAPITQTDYSPFLNTGYGTTVGNLTAQQQLANQYMAQSQGQGPNPAQAQLAQNTSNNINSQAALAAGQRGVGANAGMLQRQVAQQGAGIQQNAVGQAATLQAQQQLAAQQEAASLYGQIGQQAGTLTGQGVAGQNTQNSNLIQNYNMAQGINAQTAAQNTAAVQKTTSGILGGSGGIGSLIGGLFAQGGTVGVDNGGQSASVNVPTFATPSSQSSGNSNNNNSTSDSSGNNGSSGLIGGIMSMFSKGGNVQNEKLHPAHEPQSHVARFLKGLTTSSNADTAQMMLAEGGVDKVPGKAKVSGDSYKNDTVQAMLSPGEGIIPRSHMEDPQMAAKFAYDMVMRNKGKGK